MADIVQVFNGMWETKWPSTKPLGWLLRTQHHHRWVRFHALPESKRYPESAVEYATILARHKAVLTELGASAELFVCEPDWLGDHRLPGSFWRRVVEEEGETEPVDLYVRKLSPSSPEFDGLLAAVADDESGGVIIGPEELGWLFAPYPGGVDVIASSTSERDHLKGAFADWLPANPAGL